MNLLDQSLSRLGLQRTSVFKSSGRVDRGAYRKIRRYAAARTDRLFTGFGQSGSSSGDAQIDGKLELMRNRSRELERDNPLTVRWLKLLENNVLGSSGIQLQACAKDPDRMGPGGVVVPGQMDTLANQSLERHWKRWGRLDFELGAGVRSLCCLSGEYALEELDALALRAAFRDGSIFLRLWYGRGYGGEYGLTIQPMEADHLDIRYNANLPNGNRIRMGIEKNESGRLVAWHLFRNHPGDVHGYLPGNHLKRERVPADRIIHLYVPQRFSQSTGVPQNHAVLDRMKMLDGYDEAELVAARAGANKMGFLVSDLPVELAADHVTEEGEKYMDSEAGSVEMLPSGLKYQSHDPQHPNSGYAEYTKALKRDVAGGLAVSYTALANDLEGVNYSSIRAGVLEDREEWMKVQEWYIRRVRGPIYSAWLQLSLLNQAVTMPNGSALPFAKLEKFQQCRHIGRRWPWVDPQKDVKAVEAAIEIGLTSRTREIRKRGDDPDEIDAERAADEAAPQREAASPRGESNP